MGKQLPRALIGIAAVLVCVAGLLAVSALVPDVGCTNEGNLPVWRLKRNTHVQLNVPEQVEAGQSFSINGTLEKTGWNNPLLSDNTVEPFAYQHLMVQSTQFHQGVETDAGGNFSGIFTVYTPGMYAVTASYPGDKLENYSASSGYRLIIVTGQPVLAGKSPGFSGTSRLPFIIAAVIALVIIALNFLIRFLMTNKRPGAMVPAIPGWLSIILAVVAAGSLFLAFLPRTAPGDYDRMWDRKWNVYDIPTMITVEIPEEINAGSTLAVKGTLWQRPPGQQEYVPLPGRSIGIFMSNHSDSGLSPVTGLDATGENGRFKGKVFFGKAGKYTVFFAFSDYSKHYSECRVAKDITVNKEPLFSRWNSPGWLIVYGCLIVILLLADRLIFSRRRLKRNLTSNLIFRGLPAALVIVEITAFVLFLLRPQYMMFKGDANNTSAVASHVILEVPENAEVKQPFRIQGSLTTLIDADEIPLPGQEIEIYLCDLRKNPDWVEKLTTLATDNTGKFAEEVMVGSPGNFEISAMFENTGGLYYQSGDSRTINILDPNSIPVADTDNPYKPPVIIGVLILVIMTVISFLLGRYGIRWPWYKVPRLSLKQQTGFRPHGARKPGLGVQQEHLISPQVNTAAAHSANPLVVIGFPQIPSGMPDVWGQDDSLLVVFTVAGSSQMLAQYSLDIEFSTGDTMRSLLSPDGRASQTHTFRKPGQYGIQAVLVKEIRNGYLPALKMIRIVNYREEVVRLYNEMLVSLKLQGIALTIKMTARDVERLLKMNLPAVSGETVETLIAVFEEANYSLHPISRSAYEKMFLAVQEIGKMVIARP